MKKWLLFFGTFFWGLFAFLPASAQKIPTLDFYYSITCPHCHDEMEWFTELKKIFPDLRIQESEITLDKQNRARLMERLEALGQPFIGVPVNIIDDEVVLGFLPQKIIQTLSEKYYAPQASGNQGAETVDPSQDSQTIPNQPENTVDPKEDVSPEVLPDQAKKTLDTFQWEKFLDYSWPSMAFLLGILDGFNPCAMWSLLILLGFLLTLEDKKKQWIIGIVFLSSSGILYFGALLTYLFGFSKVSQFATSSFMTYVFQAVGLLAIITGVLSLRKSLKKEIDCEVRDAESKKRFSQRLNEILSEQNMFLLLLGVIGLAFSVNSIELVCSLAIPTSFVASLISLKLPFWKQLTAISIYDVAYMLDDIIVFLIAMWTLNLKMFSARAVQISHFIGGIILILLGGLLAFDPELLSRIFNK